MLNKVLIKETINDLPENFSTDEPIDKIFFLDKVERGDKQSENDEVISDAELEKEMKKWFR